MSSPNAHVDHDDCVTSRADEGGGQRFISSDWQVQPILSYPKALDVSGRSQNHWTPVSSMGLLLRLLVQMVALVDRFNQVELGRFALI